MARTADQIRLQGLGLVGPAFSGLNPHLAGIAGALALAETGAESVLSATRLADSPGAWLDLIGQGAGVPSSPLGGLLHVGARIAGFQALAQ